MAIIKPFRGLRPKPDLALQISCPPYDVISAEEARAMVEGQDLSFLHVVKSEIDLDPDIDPYNGRVYEKAVENFKKLMNKKAFIQEQNDCLYLYRLIMGDHEQAGIIACVSVDDYQHNIIKKHELTRADKEEDRTKHIDILNANTGLVFLSYRARESIDIIVNNFMMSDPAYDFVSSDDVRHTLWVLDKPDTISNLVDCFRQVEAIYIADGHHRSASSLRVRELRKLKNPHHTREEEYNYFLGVLVPDNQVQILSYNRIVKDLNKLTQDQFFKKLKEKFEVVASKDNRDYSPEQPHSFGMYIAGSWYCLRTKVNTFQEDDPVESLDVQILQKNVLSSILNIKDPRTDKRIDFVGGIRGLKELERRVDGGGYQVAFSLFPTSIEDLIRIADSGKVMPPKSTWFEPKMRSGLIIHLLS